MTFVLEHRQTGDTQVLGGWGYAWGALLGPVYLLAKGFLGLALVMIPISGLVFTVGGTMIVLMAFASPSAEVTTIVGFFLAALVFAVHGYLAVQLLRTGYLRQGYREGYY
ncbi:MAG: hypothetical protein J0J01_19265 [Reyranella sp.]|uniref:hypothetical protein n=1 Tax=Reyranella sp. TaxID=1929291 RepID=UPI001AD2E15D|nr:hypothetical protein [Reyranella sp.]MBN9089053.1 hypothetical protein [Reyranella sp.]